MFLVKQADGSFELTVPLPTSTGKLLYKYVVDGEWKLSPDDKIEKDESGIENNVLEESDLTTTSKGSAIPEAGGLAYTPAAAGEAKATVMPTSEPKQQSVAGEPGIHVPKDPEALAAFSTVRDVDAKALNEPELTPEEKKKQKKKVKRSQYKAKKKNKAAAAAGVSNNEGTTEETSEFNSTPEPDAATKAVEEETAKDKKAEEVLGAAAVGTVTAGAAATLASQVPVDDEATKKAYTEDPEATPVSGTHTATESAPVTSESKASEPSAPVTALDATVTGTDAPAIAKTSAPIDEPVAPKEESKPSHTGAALGVGALGVGAGAAGATAATDSSKDISAPISGHKDTPAPVAETKDTVTEPVADDIPAEDSKDLAGGSALSPVSPPQELPQEVHTLDPKAQAAEASHPAEKEVAASPVDNADLPAVAPAATAATAPAATGASTDGAPATTGAADAPEHIVKSEGSNKVIEDEEIVIAQGNGSKKEIEAALAGQNGDVTLEEIQPTKSEAERLKEEAHISESTSSKSKTKPTTTGAASSGSPAKKAPAAKTTNKPTKEEKKKKGGFMAKLKKIFN